jgi:hypothetical protein
MHPAGRAPPSPSHYRQEGVLLRNLLAPRFFLPRFEAGFPLTPSGIGQIMLRLMVALYRPTANRAELTTDDVACFARRLGKSQPGGPANEAPAVPLPGIGSVEPAYQLATAGAVEQGPRDK